MPCVAVIEKDQNLRCQLAASVQTYLLYRQEAWRVEQFSTYGDLRSFCDIALVSVDDGLDGAWYLRARDRRMVLLLIADTEKYVFQGYDLLPSAYLLKPIGQRNLEDSLAAALYKLNQSNSYTDFPTTKGSFREDTRYILYIQRDRAGSHVYTLCGDYSILAPLKRLCLPKHFVSCGDKIVNLSHLTQIARESISFYDLSLPVTWWERRQLLSHLPTVAPVAEVRSICGTPHLDSGD